MIYLYIIATFGLSVITVILVKSYIQSKHNRKDILRGIKEPTKIIVVEELSQCLHIVQSLLEEIHQYPILGLDCEWVCRKKRNPVALLQLASTNGNCVLFRLIKFGKPPLALIDLLENNSIIKVGVGINSDIHLLHQDYQIRTIGFVDVDKAAKDAGFTGGSLKRMAKDILDVELDKKKSIQCGNWEANVLSEAQIKYAALDALIPVKIMEKMLKLKTENEFLCKTDAWFCFKKLWNHAINMNHSFKSSNIGLKPKWNAKTYVEKSVGIKGPLYENCYLQDPDGRILTVCNNKKLNWYLEKGLGTEVSQSPRTLKLNFYPKEYVKNKDSLYYRIEKENKCVVCGGVDLLRRKNVVPLEYRTHFPKEIKDYKSHDVVLLCSSCHRLSVLRDQMLRQQLILECDAPVIQIGLKK